ncbi:MAG: hypothetical protein DRG78_05995, partial [Epsilonproteobacteria bacterium]
NITNDTITIDGLDMKVTIQDDNTQQYGHAHCFVSGPEDEIEGYGLSELKRQLDVVEVLGKNLLAVDVTQANYRVTLNIDNPTPEEIEELIVDIEEEIRVSVINKISTTNPQYYKVNFGTDWDVITSKLKENNLEPSDSFFMTISRIQEMNPTKDSNNLEVFKHAYSYAKKYYITNFHLKDGQPVPNFENLIEKTKINFRQKNDIIHNPNDQDIVVFKELS